MKNRFAFAAAGLLAVAGAAQAQVVYTDAVGDVTLPDGNGSTNWPHTDIQSVEISNTLSSISFKFNIVGDIAATNWAKYTVLINNLSNASTVAGNGWGRPIDMFGGSNAWVGSWADSGGGAEAYTAQTGGGAGTGGNWIRNGQTWSTPPSTGLSVALSQFSTTITVPLSMLGLAVGDTFLFDAFTTGGGGGDSAWDSLQSATPSITGYGDPYTASPILSYTVVPAPGSAALLAIGGLVAARRRRA